MFHSLPPPFADSQERIDLRLFVLFLLLVHPRAADQLTSACVNTVNERLFSRLQIGCIPVMRLWQQILPVSDLMRIVSAVIICSNMTSHRSGAHSTDVPTQVPS